MKVSPFSPFSRLRKFPPPYQEGPPPPYQNREGPSPPHPIGSPPPFRHEQESLLGNSQRVQNVALSVLGRDQQPGKASSLPPGTVYTHDPYSMNGPRLR